MQDTTWALRRQPALLKLATGQGISALGSQVALLALPLTSACSAPSTAALAAQ